MFVYVIVFALMAALFFGLRAWDKKNRAQRAILPGPAAQAENTETIDNLEFLVDFATRGGPGTKGTAGKGGTAKSDNDGSSADDGGGGGGDGG
jgi:hypothetical protein